jgi:signal peptidase I
MNPRNLLRPVRFVIFAAVAITVALFMRGRPEAFPIGDESMVPLYYPGDKLAIRVIDTDDELKVGDDVLFAVGAHAYFGRVRALPGDTVGARGGVLTVNDEPVGPVAVPGDALGPVPAGSVCVLSPNPAVTKDSRTFGFLPREQVRGIILHKTK